MNTRLLTVSKIVCTMFIVSIMLWYFSITAIPVYAEDWQANWTQSATANQEQCNACTTTSVYIDTYIDFGMEIISALRTYANTNDTTASATEQNTDQSDAGRWLESIAGNLNETAQSIASAWYVAAIISVEAAFLDSRKNLGIIFQSPALMRDRQKVDVLDQHIANTMLDLGNAGVFINKWMKSGFPTRIREIMTKYSTGTNAFLAQAQGTTSSTAPMVILQSLRTMNQDMKTYIAFGNMSVADKRDDIKPLLQHTFFDWTIRFSDAMQQDLWWPDGYYTCARAIKWITACTTLWQQAKDAWKNISSDTHTQMKQAKTKIENAVQRLSWFRSKNSDTKKADAARQALEQRQRDLLGAQYGRKWIKNSDWKPIVQWFWDAWKSVKNDITDTWWPLAWLSTIREKNAKEPFIIGDADTSSYIQNKEFKNAFFLVAEETAALWATQRQESIFANSSTITQAIPLITQEIKKMTYLIEANNNDSIRKNLWQACEAQCSNVAGRCWSK